jgi:hypothetical protein
MTIDAPIEKRVDYDGDDIETSFAYAVEIDEQTYLEVIHTNTSGVANSLGDPLVDVDYTVNGVGDIGGGTIDFPKAGSVYSTLATGERLSILYIAPIEQTLDLPNVGRVFNDAVEDKLDYIVKLINQAMELHDRSLRLPDNSELTNITVPVGATSAFKWNENADALELIALTPGINIDPLNAKGDIIQGDANGDSENLSIGGAGAMLQVLSGILSYLAIGSTNAVLQVINGQLAWVTNPTLLLPTIADLTNMTHDHSDAANGGVISSTAGKIVQVVNVQTNAMTTGTTELPTDDTIPLSGEGDELFSLGITPLNAANILEFECVVFMASTTAANAIAIALFKDSGSDALAVGAESLFHENELQNVTLKFQLAAGSVTPATYKIRVGGGNASETVTVNGVNGSRLYGGVLYSSLIIRERTP